MMSRLGQYAARLIERVGANLSGINLAILIVFLGLGGIAVFSVFNGSKERYATLFDGRTFSNTETEQIEAALFEAQLRDFRFVDSRLEVPIDSRHQYVKVLNDASILSSGFHEALSEAIKNSSILDSHRKTELKNQLAIGNDTGKLLCRISEIQNAFVHFIEEPLPGLHRRKKVTASVIIECKQGKRLSDSNIQGIRSLVTTLRPGLNTNGITVTEFSDQKMTVHAAGDTVTEKTGIEKSVAIQQQYERQWERKVREAVDYIPSARVTVTAESNESSSQSSVATFRPSKLGVLINIPTSYYHQVWRTKASEVGMTGNRRPTYDDLRRLRLQIEDKIASNIESLTAAHVQADVSVTSFADDIASPTRIDSRLSEMQIWTFLGSLGIVAIAIAAFHYQSRRTVKASIERTKIPQEANWDANARQNAAPNGDDLRKKISDVIRDDPEAAAQVLGEWMKKAG